MLVTKEVLRPGTYYTDSGVLRVSPRDIHHYCTTGNAMVNAGLAVPVPLDHQPTANPVPSHEAVALSLRNNTGFVKRFFLEGDALMSELDIVDAEIYPKLAKTIRFVSPQISSGFMDGSGKQWSNCITHVALTNRPRFANQTPFQAQLAINSIRGDVQLSLDAMVPHTLMVLFPGNECQTRTQLVCPDKTVSPAQQAEFHNQRAAEHLDAHGKLTDELVALAPDLRKLASLRDLVRIQDAMSAEMAGYRHHATLAAWFRAQPAHPGQPPVEPAWPTGLGRDMVHPFVRQDLGIGDKQHAMSVMDMSDVKHNLAVPDNPEKLAAADEALYDRSAPAPHPFRHIKDAASYEGFGSEDENIGVPVRTVLKHPGHATLSRKELEDFHANMAAYHAFLEDHYGVVRDAEGTHMRDAPFPWDRPEHRRIGHIAARTYHEFLRRKLRRESGDYNDMADHVHRLTRDEIHHIGQAHDASVLGDEPVIVSRHPMPPEQVDTAYAVQRRGKPTQFHDGHRPVKTFLTPMDDLDQDALRKMSVTDLAGFHARLQAHHAAMQNDAAMRHAEFMKKVEKSARQGRRLMAKGGGNLHAHKIRHNQLIDDMLDAAGDASGHAAAQRYHDLATSQIDHLYDHYDSPNDTPSPDLYDKILAHARKVVAQERPRAGGVQALSLSLTPAGVWIKPSLLRDFVSLGGGSPRGRTIKSYKGKHKRLAPAFYAKLASYHSGQHQLSLDAANQMGAYGMSAAWQSFLRQAAFHKKAAEYHTRRLAISNMPERRTRHAKPRKSRITWDVW